MKDKIINLGFSKREVEELLTVSKDIESDYKKLLNKYPIQYLIGYVNFYGYKINVNESVLIPRYETEFLVEKVIKYCKREFNKKISILDIGTGSGCIGIVLSKELDSDVTCSDISDDALEVAKKNAKENNTNIKFINSDMLNNISDKYDLIISNPPYISYDEEVMESVKKYEPHLALYADNNGLYYYKEILKNISKNLKEKYIIAFEIGMNQAESISNIARKYLDNIKIVVEKDLSNKDRYLFIFSE